MCVSHSAFPFCLVSITIWREGSQAVTRCTSHQGYFFFKDSAVVFWQLPGTPVVSLKSVTLAVLELAVCGKGKQNSSNFFFFFNTKMAFILNMN